MSTAATTRTAPKPTLTGTLATRRLHDLWLPGYLSDSAAADHLKAMWQRRKPGPQSDALWRGYHAMAEAARLTVERIRDRGGLLFAWHGSAALQGGGA